MSVNFQNVITKTIQIVEATLNLQLSNKIIDELTVLLNEYLDETLKPDKKLFNAGCWGGGVWDRLYHYHDEYKPVLVSNYRQYEFNNNVLGRRISPIYSNFPHKKLNSLCIQALGK